MHGRGGENKERVRHMWSVPTVAGDSVAFTADSFCKDGRKISVGDCALFKPPQDSPPFIGIIRWLTLYRENNLQLGVNWLYRPIEVKLGKGILRDAAPNEVFYSFHKDEIPAASLLHPCKVAFLPKGVELPSGISSFVCHRVYDIANRCLWWLTDQNYIDERQEEVDQLLRKTQIEMHATVQPDGRSQKPLNGQTSTSLLKPCADNIQSASSPSHAKGKKRDRADQGSEPFKRERFSKTGDGDSVQFKPESILKSDISKITEKGGLVDSEGVEKLVQLMQLDGRAKKLELISRSMLAGVIAATENFDCLSRFVQLKGLTVLDEWLQDVHKGKIDHGSPKDGDKSVEEFLFVLLRALGKLPVNLHALQMCNIGKSVNHLRSHKNLEIQKKARSLVDIWKKRVEAEMNVIDSKSGSTQAVSWATRSRLSEVSHGGNRHPGGSSEVVMKNSVTQLYASKPASVKAVQVEITAKSTSSSPGPMKSTLSPASGKDGQPRIVVGSTSDLPSTTAREERSSSSSQSHNNSQSCSSDHAKTTAFSGKEDARSSTAGSISVNKMSGSASRHRRSVNGFSGPAVSGGQRETGSNRSSSLHRNSASEKFSQSGFTGEKALDVPIAEGNSHKLIVKIPKRGRSPAHSASGGSVEDPSIMTSRASSPVLSDKFDQYDRHSKDKSDANRVNTIFDVNTESWQSNDFKDVLTASDKGDGSPDAIPEERSRAGEEAAKLAAFSSSGNKLKSQNSLEASFSSMNALMESCVKYSTANASMLAGDNVGMNLLASVAAEEMSKSDLISPIDSPRRSTHMVEDCCTGDATKSKSSNVNNLAQEQSRSADGAVADGEQGVVSDNSYSWNELDTLPEQGSGDFSGDGRTSSSLPNGEGNECNSSNLQTSAEPCLEINVRSDEFRATAYLAVSRAGGTEKILDGEKSKLLHEKTTVASVDGIQDTIPKGSSSLLTEYNVKEATSSDAGERAAAAGSSSYESLEIDGEKKNNLSQGLNDCRNTEQTPPSVKVQSESLERSDEDLLHHSSSGSGKNLPPESEEKLSGGKDDEMGTRSHVKQKIDHGTNSAITNENQVLNGRGSAGSDQKSEGLEASVENKEVLEHSSGGVVLKTESSACPAQEVKQHMRSRESKMTGREANGTEESPSIAADAASGTSEYTKLKFDLNEGFIADEGKYTEPINFSGPGSSDFNPLPCPLTSISTGLPASITVAAAAKGPFVPPEDLLRSKGELGWKGSAATSAFRPAEPRKVLEMPLGTTNTTLPNATAGKQGRPLLDFDLNVPDERILEDLASRSSPQEVASASDHISNRDLARNDLMGSVPIRSSGGLDLDLNQVDETNDLGQYPASNIRRLDALLLPVNSSSSGGFPNFEARRDFDLNNGPAFDEASAGPSSFSHYGRSSMQSQPHVSSLKMNNADMGTFSSWFTTGNAYPAVTIPSILADRGGNPFPIVATGGPPRMLGPATGGASFNPDIYRGSVLSSSPSVPFPSTPFQYPVYPFGAFPLPSANLPGGSTTYMDSSSSGRLFPAVNSQLLGPAATMSTPQYPRPYVVSFPDCSNNIGVDDNRKGSRHGLDLNSGPGSLDREGRDETSPLALRQLSVASSQALAEEQARMYHQLVGGIWKRKDPEGGWDADNFRHKQSWQ
ncbi:Cell wall protein [Actinidia chinensis var. chinensis]|uniref:Cell wall protein n=1 Tax=Actinidia chinensis var. chinensis TaxID=1590841 RepID=A0A2R6PS74_ACTCC|nr:Cell wall protein [Actinidia chinensis var. chinensis]